jgi:hypothetical protein
MTTEDRSHEKPQLGLATTRELLAEISARIDVDYALGGGGLDYTTVGGRPTVPSGNLAGGSKRVGRDCQQVGCDQTVSDGPLIRVNPKGERGVFMCEEHAVGPVGGTT